MAYLIGNKNPRAGMHGEIGLGNFLDDIIKTGQDVAKNVADTAGSVQKTAASFLPGSEPKKKKSGGGASLTALPGMRGAGFAPSFGAQGVDAPADNTMLYVGGAVAVGAAFLLLNKKR